MSKQSSVPDRNDRPSVAELIDELRQPLAAACNYIAAVRSMIQSNTLHPQKAADSLVKAEAQILRAGEITREMRRAVAIEETRH